jgi:hypothetical protein
VKNRLEAGTIASESEEQIIVIEKNAAVTAVAEVSEPDIADAVIQYHHISHRI